MAEGLAFVIVGPISFVEMFFVTYAVAITLQNFRLSNQLKKVRRREEKAQ